MITYLNNQQQNLTLGDSIVNDVRFYCFLMLFVIFLATLNMSCGTSGDKKSLEREVVNLGENSKNEDIYEMVKEPVLLNVVVRRLGMEYPISIALLNGVESRWVLIEKPEKKLDKFLTQVISATGLVCYSEKGYYFLYPPELPLYESLAKYSFVEMMPANFNEVKVNAGFGVDTKLYNVLNSLNYTYGCNIVADNTLAELPIGEIVTHQLSLDLVLEMVIKSARISPQTLKICSGEDYLFLYTALNKNAELLENCKLFEDNKVPEKLKKNITFSLPEIVRRGRTLPFYDSAKPLKEVTAVISAQVGIDVELQPGTEELPVNPMYVSNLSVKKALDLLVYQWLDNKYSYVFEDGKIKFVIKR